MKKDNGLKLFVLLIEDFVETTEVHLFSNWNAVVDCVAEKSQGDAETIRESLDESNAWVDETANVSYTVTTQGIEG